MGKRSQSCKNNHIVETLLADSNSDARSVLLKEMAKGEDYDSYITLEEQEITIDGERYYVNMELGVQVDESGSILVVQILNPDDFCAWTDSMTDSEDCIEDPTILDRISLFLENPDESTVTMLQNLL